MPKELSLNPHNRQSRDWYISFLTFDRPGRQPMKDYRKAVREWMNENGQGDWMFGFIPSREHTAIAFENFKDELGVRLSFGHMVSEQSPPEFWKRTKFPEDSPGRMPWGKGMKGRSTWHKVVVRASKTKSLFEIMQRIEFALELAHNGNFSSHVVNWNDCAVVIVQDNRDVQIIKDMMA